MADGRESRDVRDSSKALTEVQVDIAVISLSLHSWKSGKGLPCWSARLPCCLARGGLLTFACSRPEQLARAVSLIHEMVPKVVMQNGDDPDGAIAFFSSLPPRPACHRAPRLASCCSAYDWRTKRRRSASSGEGTPRCLDLTACGSRGCLVAAPTAQRPGPPPQRRWCAVLPPR